MKKILFALALLATPAAAQNSPFLWRYHPKPGTHWTMHGNQTIVINQSSSGVTARGGKAGTMKVSMTISQTSVMDVDVLPRDGAGNTVTRMIFRGMKMTTKTVAKGMPKGQPMPPDMSGEIAANALNSPLIVKSSPMGEVVDVQGLQALSKQVQAKAKSLSGGQKMMLLPLITCLQNKETFRTSLIWNEHIPAQAMRPGQKILFKFTLPKGVAMVEGVDVSRTLVKRSGGTAVYADSGTFSKSRPPLSFRPGAPKATVTVTGTFKASRQVDEQSGLSKTLDVTITSQTGYKVTGKMPPGFPTSGMRATMTFHTTVVPRH